MGNNKLEMRNKKHCLLFCFLFLISYFPFPVYSHASEEKITAIEVEGANRITKEDLIDIIGLNAGDAVDKDILRTGIKRAFKKGIFLDITAETVPFEDGVKLRYIVREISVIDKINIEGNDHVSKGKIKKALLVREGEDFREELLPDAQKAVSDFYALRGFPDAKVRIEAKTGKAPYKINLDILIEEGAPLIIKKISVPEDIEGMLKVHAGDIFDVDKVTRDISKIKDFYKKQGYIKPIAGPYEFHDGELKIPAAAGAKLEVKFNGNTAFSSKRLLKEATFLEDEEVTDELTEDAANRIKKLYLQSGYNHSKVAAGTETKEDIIVVTFFIFEGNKVILREIRFEGIIIPRESIESVMPFKTGAPFDETLLEIAKESITGLYNGLGYLSAEVKEIKKDFTKDGSELSLLFVIYEGQQTKIKKIDIAGNKAISSEEIIKAIGLKESLPYNAIDIGDARYRVLSLYNKLGYADANIEIESALKEDGVYIVFKIAEGMPSYIGKVIIRGHRKTKEKILKRELAFKEGELYDQEKLLKTKQRLYKLGLFTEVSIEPLKSTETRTERGHLIKDILVSLKEGNAGAIEIGFGYGDYEGFRGFFDVSYRNLGGYQRQAGLRTELSSVENRYILSFKEPWFLNKQSLPLTVTLLKEDKKAINLDTKETLYEIDRTSLIAAVNKDFTDRLKGSLSYEYSLVDTKDVKPEIILSKEDTGTLGIGSISPSLFYDTRDNPFDPASGSLKGAVIKVASKALASETEFIKVTLHGAWFFEMQKGLVLALSLRGGAAYGMGNTTELPLVERFFLGGRTTVRGYSQDTLGPKGADNTPTGGNAFALANGEARISLGKGLGMVVFLDSGNVWQDTNDINLTLKYTTGAGLRYNTPVGPFRIDYGHKLNREGDESRGELHFSLGHAF
ncbi:MAG: outer membrane protein assembly factor BamA [Nitrospirae bacterium]|nr:outer membrane protein assembly factor BamA [Nitrospirota bacterium]